MYHKVSFEDAKQIIDNEQNYMILDVREEDEYITGHATNAVLFPLGSITPEGAASIIPDKDTYLLIYCRSGNRSHEAAEKLLNFGYKNIYDIGSLVGWPYGISW